jgi:hypothetical protein
MKYLLLHYIDESILTWGEGKHEVSDPAEEQALKAWDEEMIARGILVGGAVLRPTSETAVLRVRDGEFLVSDGPFAETKEQIAGYCVLECASRDEAVEVSLRHPTAQFGTFELRQFG